MSGVAVTGLGPVSSIGIGAEPFAAALRAGRSGISEITSFDASGFSHRRAGEVHDFDPSRLLHRLELHRWGRSARFAAAAARLALDDGRLDHSDIDPARTGVVVGTTSGESVVIEALTAQIVAAGLNAMDVGLLEQLPAERLATAVSTELALAGESVTLATACSASNYAIGYGYDLIASGEADIAFAGGADSVCRWAHAGFFRLGALAETSCSPFDRNRTGMLTGEGGAMIMMESLSHAQRRGAPIYATVLGYGINCDANHPVAPDLGSIVECMHIAHRNSSVKPSEIDYICAHGTGTPTNDAVEAKAIAEVFGERLPPVSSIKSMIGHTMGAASGFGAIAAILAIRHGFLPPTISWTTTDPEFPGLDPVPNRARPARVTVAQNDGFAFGGNNAITLFGALS